VETFYASRCGRLAGVEVFAPFLAGRRRQSRVGAFPSRVAKAHLLNLRFVSSLHGLGSSDLRIVPASGGVDASAMAMVAGWRALGAGSRLRGRIPAIQKARYSWVCSSRNLIGRRPTTPVLGLVVQIARNLNERDKSVQIQIMLRTRLLICPRSPTCRCLFLSSGDFLHKKQQLSGRCFPTFSYAIHHEEATSHPDAIASHPCQRIPPNIPSNINHYFPTDITLETMFSKPANPDMPPGPRAVPPNGAT